MPLQAFRTRAETLSVATEPRIITPGRTVYLTIRAVGRQFRFVPEQDVVDSINYIFWHCVEEYDLEVHEFVWMSNHAHLCVTDVEGVLPDFMGKMNSLISRQLNKLRKVKGTNIEKGYSDIEVLDSPALLELCSYTLANPCKAGLVARAGEWRGVTSYHLEYDESFVVERPNCGLWAQDDEEGEDAEPSGNRKYARPRSFRPGLRSSGRRRASNQSVDQPKKGKPKRRIPSQLPLQVSAKLTRPPVELHLTDAELRSLIRERTQAREENAAKSREEEGKSVLGWKRVLQTKWNDYPDSFEPRPRQKPRVAAADPQRKKARLHQISTFNTHYRAALIKFIERGKEHALFPWGTWKMRVFFLAECELPPPERLDLLAAV